MSARRSRGSRGSRKTPVSASEMSMRVFSIDRMRSDSSRQSESASRCAAASPDCNARPADADDRRERRAPAPARDDGGVPGKDDLGAVADLQDGAVGQTGGGDLEHGVARTRGRAVDTLIIGIELNDVEIRPAGGPADE